MIKYEIIEYQQVTSTNEVLKNLCDKKGVEEGTVILADFQTSGRGRGNHSWYSKEDENLLMSLCLKPMIRASDHFHINELISLSVIDTLEDYGLRAKIKWPNDIYLNGGKLGGLLIENSLSGDRISRSIIGLGLNLNATDFPPELPNPISVKMVTGDDTDKTAFLNRLLECFTLRYEQFGNKQWKEMHFDYLQKVFCLGETVEYSSAGKYFKATLEDIRPQGEIILRTGENMKKSFLYSEITLLI